MKKKVLLLFDVGNWLWRYNFGTSCFLRSPQSRNLITWQILTWISTWPFRPWKPLFPPIILGLKIRPKTAAAALFDELLAGGELSLSGSWVSSSGRTRCSRSSSRCSFYNKFITCFHESWIYEIWIFSMKSVVCFHLF